MENIISTLIATLHPTVLPLVVVILGLYSCELTPP